LVCDLAAAIIAATTTLLQMLTQAAAATHLELRVVTSTKKTANAAALHVCTASLFHVHSFGRETMWWWLALARIKMW
jgi:hypothetical protein